MNLVQRQWCLMHWKKLKKNSKSPLWGMTRKKWLFLWLSLVKSIRSNCHLNLFELHTFFFVGNINNFLTWSMLHVKLFHLASYKVFARCIQALLRFVVRLSYFSLVMWVHLTTDVYVNVLICSYCFSWLHHTNY